MKVINFIVNRITLLILIILSNILYPHRVYGRKNIPKDTPFVLYANHMSIIDPVFLRCILWNRSVYFMGKEELFKNKFLNWFFTANNGFPVKRGSADMHAIKKCINHLKDGDVMMIFPEGTRNKVIGGELQKFHNGIGIVLMQSKKNALPVYIENKKGLRIFSFSKVHIGEIVDMSEYTSKRMNSENLDSCVQKLKNELTELGNNC